MDVAGIGLAVVGLAGQLFSASLEGYEILSNMGAFGLDYDKFVWRVGLEKQRLSSWAEHWLSHSRLDPSNGRHRHAVATLARVAALFADIDKFTSKYGLKLTDTETETKTKSKNQLSLSRAFESLSTRRRSNSPSPSRTEISDESIEHLLTILPLGEHDLGLRSEISRMKEAAGRLQRHLLAWRKLRWAVADRAKVDRLAELLKEYNDGLYNLLPPPSNHNDATLDLTLSPTFLPFEIPACLPYRQNTNFRGRDDILKEIQSAFDDAKARQLAQRTVVLYGLGGAGKSQIALEYAYRSLYTTRRPKFTSVLWVDVTNSRTIGKSAVEVAERLVQHYRGKYTRDTDVSKIALELGIHVDPASPGRLLVNSEEDEMQVIRAVKGWLESTDNNDFLIILDNWDNPETDINVLLPPRNGNIIITSRQTQLDYLGECLEVDMIDKDAGIELLMASARKMRLNDSEMHSAIALAEKLGYLPLALNQAGAYISSTQISFSKYHLLYDDNFKEMASKQSRIHTDQKDTVFTTWELSFLQLSKQAQELLLLCGFIGNQDIVDEIFERAATIESVTEYMPWMKGGVGWLQDAIGNLLSLSFVKRIDSNLCDSISIHPLVHAWCRERLDATIRRKKEVEAVILLSCFWKKNYNKKPGDWMFERRIYTHITLACGNIARYAEATSIWNQQFYDAARDIARIMLHQGSFQSALNFLIVVCERSQDLWGDEYELVLELDHVLGEAYHELCIYDKALEYYKRALARQEKVLGKEHPTTLSIVNAIANLLQDQDNYEDALEWYARALDGRGKILGWEHPETLSSAANVALTLNYQGKYDDALEKYRRVLSGTEKVLGKNHPDTWASVHDIAFILSNQGKHDDALEEYRRVLAGQEKILGREHPRTLLTVSNIAWVFIEQGKYDDALEWYQRALAGREKALGKEHPDTLYMVYHMARVFEQQGKYEDALEWYRRALAGEEKVLGKEHPDTLYTVYHMARVFEQQGKYEDALEWYRRTLAGEEKVKGKEHVDTKSTARDIERLQRKML